MSIASETLTRSHRSFTSADSTATDYIIISASTVEGKAITSAWIINGDTKSHAVTVTLETYNGVAWETVAQKSYTLLAEESAVLPEFIGALIYRSDGNSDRIKAQIAESVNSSKSVYVYFSGAAFAAS